jgi:hypothetical protein
MTTHTSTPDANLTYTNPDDIETATPDGNPDDKSRLKTQITT